MRNKFIFSVVLTLSLMSCAQIITSEKNQPPDAGFSVTPKEGTTMTEFAMNGSFSTDDHDKTKELGYFWEYYSQFGKLIDTAFGQLDTMTFGDTGQYVINLSVFDSDSLSDTHSDTIRVSAYHAPQLKVVDTTIRFSPVEAGFTVKKNLKIENLGSDSLTIKAVYFSGANKALFSSNFDSPMTISPDSIFVLSILFSPRESGNFSGAVNINSNDPQQSTLKIDIQAEAFQDLYDLKLMNVFSDSIDFGAVEVAADSTLSLRIKNYGNESREILAAYVTGAGKSAFDCDFYSDFNIPAEEEKKLDVIFSPPDTLRYTANLVLKSNDRFETEKTISMSGKGYKKYAALSLPDLTNDEIDFGLIDVGQQTAYQLMIQNTGESTLDISAILTTGADAQNFNCNFDEVISITPNNSKNVMLHFTPDSNRSYQTTLQIHSNDPKKPVQKITLKGTGAQSQLEIISLTENRLNFNDVLVGTDSTITLNLLNSGNRSLTITDAYIIDDSNHGFFTNFSNEIRILPGEWDSLSVEFLPQDTLAYSGTLVISTDEEITKKLTIELAGSGIANKMLSLSRNSLDFGYVNVDSDSSLQLTLHNQGNKALILYDNYFSGDNRNLFTSNLPEEFTLPRNQSHAIQITFLPDDTSPVTGNNFILSSNDPTYPMITVPITAQGVYAAKVETVDSLDFGRIKLSDSSAEQLRIKNTGLGTLENLKLTVESQYFSVDLDDNINLKSGNVLQINIFFNPVGDAGEKRAQLDLSAAKHGIIKSILLKGEATEE